MSDSRRVGDGVHLYLSEALPGVPELEGVRVQLFKIATGSTGEAAVIADRMLEASGSPMPEEVHRFARAVGLLCAGAIYGREKDARLRRADLLAEVLAEVAAIHEERAA